MDQSPKDNFSEQAGAYAKYRPVYPPVLFEHILEHTTGREQALDCACGNGQATLPLASHFKKVSGIDISEKQLNLAKKASNISYTVSRSEQTPFEDQSFDLISVAQAFHWFDHPAFFEEVKRIAKPGATVALFGYVMGEFSNEIDMMLHEFYENTVGPYWDPERMLVEEQYQSVSMPIPMQPIAWFHHDMLMTQEDLAWYLSSWSAVQHYIRDGRPDPVPQFMEEIQPFWSGKALNYRFPIFLRLGKVL